MRTWVALLALANAAFFVWTSGWASPWLPAPWQGQREPQRLENQLNPELVAVRRPLAAAGAQPARDGAAPTASAASATSGMAASAPSATASPAASRTTGAAPAR